VPAQQLHLAVNSARRAGLGKLFSVARPGLRVSGNVAVKQYGGAAGSGGGLFGSESDVTVQTARL